MTGFLHQALEALKNLLTWWITVAPWEQAIRVRFGKRVRLLQAGVHLRVPVIDRVYRQSVRRRASVMPAQTLVTKDGRPLTVAVMAGYRIADLLLLYQTLHHAEGTIQSLILGAVGEYVVEQESGTLTPGGLARDVAKAADLKRFGLDEVTVTITTFAFVKTYRLITGEGSSWHIGEGLNTSREDLEPQTGGLG